jgi:hypothetical protein
MKSDDFVPAEKNLPYIIIVMQMLELKGTYQRYGDYGSTGCGVFKGGIQN